MSPTIGSTAGGAVRSRPPWWMFVLAAAFIGYFGLLLHSDLTRPEPAGFVFGIHESEMFVRAVAPASSAARAGLAVGDRVLSANAHPVRSRLDWVRGCSRRLPSIPSCGPTRSPPPGGRCPLS